MHPPLVDKDKAKAKKDKGGTMEELMKASTTNERKRKSLKALVPQMELEKGIEKSGGDQQLKRQKTSAMPLRRTG